MYREIYNLARRNKLGYLVIGASAEKFDEACKNALRNEKEAVVIMSENGARLVSCGTIEEDIISEIVEQTSSLTNRRKPQFHVVFWNSMKITVCISAGMRIRERLSISWFRKWDWQISLILLFTLR